VRRPKFFKSIGSERWAVKEAERKCAGEEYFCGELVVVGGESKSEVRGLEQFTNY
jgi:hypothetical protein